jgi:hypothetical protein
MDTFSHPAGPGGGAYEHLMEENGWELFGVSTQLLLFVYYSSAFNACGLRYLLTRNRMV